MAKQMLRYPCCINKKIKWVLELGFKLKIIKLFYGISQGLGTNPLLCIRPMATTVEIHFSSAPRWLCETLVKEKRGWG